MRKNYEMKPYFMTDDDISVICAVSKRINQGNDVVDYFGFCLFSLASRLEKICKQMREEFK